RIPTGAVPGTHWISAIGRASNAAGQASFSVRSDWGQAGFDATHDAWDLTENLISASNVSSLAGSWTGGTGSQSPLDSSPTVVGGVLYAGSYDGKLYAFDANCCGGSTCSAPWTGSTAAAIKGSVAAARGVP